MPKLKDMKQDERGPKIICYGRPGSGKSAFWLTLGSTCLYLDCDCGWRTGKTLKDRWSEERGEVELKECWETDGQKATAFSKTDSLIKTFAAGIKTGKIKERVIVVDSFTSLAEGAMRDVLYTCGRLGTNPEIQHWGMMFNKILGLVMNLKSLPVAVVLIMHDQINEIDDRNYIDLAIPGQKLSPKIKPYFDEIIYAKVKNLAGGKTGYTIQTKSTASLQVRSRSNLPGEFDMNEGAQKLFQLMGYSTAAQGSIN